MPDRLKALHVGATANIDQVWTSYRHMLFSMGFKEVGDLAERLDSEDGGEWLVKQHPDVIQIVAMIASVAAVRMSLEICEGAGGEDGEEVGRFES